MPKHKESTTAECIEYLLHYFKTGETTTSNHKSSKNVVFAEGEWVPLYAKVLTAVKGGVCPKNAEAAAELSGIFGVMVTVETIIHYEKSETKQDKAYFVPSIEDTPFKISPSKCATKLGPQAIIRMHGIH